MAYAFILGKLLCRLEYRYFNTDEAFVEKPFMSLKRTDIDSFLANMVNTHDLNVKAFNSASNLLKQMLEYASDNDYISENPFRVKREIKKHCIPMRRKPGNQETYTDEEIRLISDEMERRLIKNPDNTAPLDNMK